MMMVYDYVHPSELVLMLVVEWNDHTEQDELNLMVDQKKKWVKNSDHRYLSILPSSLLRDITG